MNQIQPKYSWKQCLKGNSFVSSDNVDIKAAPNYTMLQDKLILSTVTDDVSDEDANTDEH